MISKSKPPLSFLKFLPATHSTENRLLSLRLVSSSLPWSMRDKCLYQKSIMRLTDNIYWALHFMDGVKKAQMCQVTTKASKWLEENSKQNLCITTSL